MRSFFALAITVFLFIGCNDTGPAPNPAPIRVDGEYWLTYVDLQNSCDPQPKPAALNEHRLDIQANLDLNFVDILPDQRNYWLPRFEKVPLTKEGAVKKIETWRNGVSGQYFNQLVEGQISKEKLELTFTTENGRRDGTPCVVQSRVEGTRRETINPERYDGEYLVDIGYFGNRPYGIVCPEDDPEEYPGALRRLDVYERPDSGSPMMVALPMAELDFHYGAVIFDLSNTPGADGQVNWQGPVAVGAGFGSHILLPGSLTGTFLPSQLNLVMTWSVPDAECWFQYSAHGAKRRFSRESISNYYRVRFEQWDLCQPGASLDGPTTREPYETVIDLYQFDDETLVLTDEFGLRTELQLDKNLFATKYTYDNDYGPVEVTNRGTVGEGQLEYTFESHYQANNCSVITKVKGRGRFFLPEQ